MINHCAQKFIGNVGEGGGKKTASGRSLLYLNRFDVNKKHEIFHTDFHVEYLRAARTPAILFFIRVNFHLAKMFGAKIKI